MLHLDPLLSDGSSIVDIHHSPLPTLLLLSDINVTSPPLEDQATPSSSPSASTLVPASCSGAENDTTSSCQQSQQPAEEATPSSLEPTASPPPAPMLIRTSREF